MDFNDLNQQKLDDFKKLFPDNKELQSISLSELAAYSKQKDTKAYTAQVADVVPQRESRLLPISDCQWAIGDVVVDCIFVATGFIGLRKKLPRSAVEGVARAIEPELSEIEKYIRVIGDAKSSNKDIAWNIFYIGKLIYTGGMLEAVIRAIFNSLTPWDMALYGTLALSELCAAFLTDGAALVALEIAELANAGFLISDSVKVMQDCQLATA